MRWALVLLVLAALTGAARADGYLPTGPVVVGHCEGSWGWDAQGWRVATVFGCEVPEGAEVCLSAGQCYPVLQVLLQRRTYVRLQF